MNIGMLWFDNDPKVGLTTKVERAAAYYRTKYGRSPTLCFVHPSMLAKITSPASNETSPKSPENYPTSMSGVEVRSNRSVLPNHFWIGINNGNGSEPKPH